MTKIVITHGINAMIAMISVMTANSKRLNVKNFPIVMIRYDNIR